MKEHSGRAQRSKSESKRAQQSKSESERAQRSKSESDRAQQSKSESERAQQNKAKVKEHNKAKMKEQNKAKVKKQGKVKLLFHILFLIGHLFHFDMEAELRKKDIAYFSFLEPSHPTMLAPKCWAHSQTPHYYLSYRIRSS